ncbi:hypothetical protein V2G26_005964 [Clonostachys chloroleuca]
MIGNTFSDSLPTLWISRGREDRRIIVEQPGPETASGVAIGINIPRRQTLPDMRRGTTNPPSHREGSTLRWQMMDGHCCFAP